MASKKLKTEVMDIEIGHEGFSILRKFGLGRSGEDELEKLADARKLLNSQKARILHVLKTQKPDSIYSLAKALGRDFQSVKKDIMLLQKFGLVELEKHYGKDGKSKRKSLKPVLQLDKLQINITL